MNRSGTIHQLQPAFRERAFGRSARLVKSRGFTLVEMMVVITLIAIVSSAAMLSLAGLGARSERAHIEGIAAHLQKAWLWSELSHQSTRVLFDESGYQIENWAQNSWRASPNFKASGRHDFAYELVLNSSAENLMESDILFFAGGEYTAFDIDILGEDRSYALQGDGYNAPELVLQ